MRPALPATPPGADDGTEVSMTDAPAQPEPAISRGRRRLALAVLAGLVAGHGYAVATGGEAWPFSRYTLYSKRYEAKPFRQQMLYGVARDDGREVRLDHRHFPPYFHQQYVRALRRAFPWDEPTGGRETAALPRWLAMYESNRLAGRHGGPRLAALRLETEEWRYDPAAANRGKPPDLRVVEGEHRADDDREDR